MRHAPRGPRHIAALMLVGIAAAACAASPTAITLPSARLVAALPSSLVLTAAEQRAATASTLPPSPSLLGRFAPVYMGSGWNFTQAQAVALAQQFDVIAAQATVFPKYVTAMKAAKPNLRILGYLNGMFDLTSGGTAYPSSWYALDKNGNRIRSTFGNWLLNPGNPSWAEAVASQCTSIIARSGYDGCFIDTLGTAPLDPGYCTGLAIDPATHQVWTDAEWIAATSEIARTVQSANPNAVIMDNGLADGQKYYNSSGSTEPLIAATHLAMAELWLRSNGTPADRYRSEADWLQDVNMVVNAQAQGFWIATTTKLWVPATSAQQTAWQKYALASFLLAANGKAYFSFMPSSSNSGLIYDSPWDHINIGTPTDAFAKVNGVYQRDFTNGIAAVNPTTTTATISLGGTYTSLNGQQVTSETLAPNTGDVFVKA